MLKAQALYTKKREQSDMADLEILGSISFDLNINKQDEIKNAFISLVSKLGTQEFLEEYSVLYKKILSIYSQRENNLFYTEVSDLLLQDLDSNEYEGHFTSSSVSNMMLGSCLLNEILISSTEDLPENKN